MAYRQDPRDNQYYNNGSGNLTGYGGYQQEQLSGNYYNPRMANDGYRSPNRMPYSSSNSNMRGSPSGQARDDDDNLSVGSSVYSQPSAAGFTPPDNISNFNNTRYYQEESLEMPEQRRQSLLFNEYNEYPPSPFAASTNTRNSGTGNTAGSSQQGLPLIDQHENNYMEENQYQNLSQNTQPQFDVYKDFNNYQNDEKYDEESRNNTLTEPDGTNFPKSFATNIDSGKGNRQSTAGDHYVVTPKKRRRCAFCSRKTCVIITFIVLVLLAGALYFIWPRIPNINFIAPAPLGDANITSDTITMQMNLQFELDNRENWLPYTFNSLDITIIDANDVSTNGPITSASKKGFSIPGRAKSTVFVPVLINYSGGPSDVTFHDLENACVQQSGNGTKPFLNFLIGTKMFIRGLDWVNKPTKNIPVVNFPCPFNATAPPEPTSAAGPTPDNSNNSQQPAAGVAPAPTPGAAPATTPGAETPAAGTGAAPAAGAGAPAAGGGTPAAAGGGTPAAAGGGTPAAAGGGTPAAAGGAAPPAAGGAATGTEASPAAGT